MAPRDTGTQPLSLIMVDVDCFKQFNDLYGHREGDHCLKRVSNALAQALTRPGDLLARYGGEEFDAILPGINIEGARWMGERLRNAVMALRIPQKRPDGARQVSISVGCASVRPSPNLACYSLLQTADEQLYVAKHSGRNCVRWQLFIRPAWRSNGRYAPADINGSERDALKNRD